MKRVDLEAMTDGELAALADELGIQGVRWLPRAALIPALSMALRTRSILERAKAMILPSEGESRTPASTSASTSTSTSTSRSTTARPEPEPDEEPPPASVEQDLPPLASETIARLYEAQGKPAKAAAVRKLLAEPAARGVDAVECARDGGSLAIVWEATRRGLRGAELHLGATGRLALRVVTTAPGAAAATRDVPLDAPLGRIEIDAPPRAVSIAAVGLLAADGRFAPIAHAPEGRPAFDPRGSRG